MAGKRMLHANICESRKLSSVSVGAETLYYRLLTRCDDNGNFYADAVIVRGQCLPLRKGISTDKVEGWIKELAAVQSIDEDRRGLIGIYSHAGEKYIHVSRFHEFQSFRVDVKSDIRYPVHPKEMGPENVNGKWFTESVPDTVRARNAFDTRPEQPVEGDVTSSPTTRSGSIYLSSSLKGDKTEEKKEERGESIETVVKRLQVVYRQRWNRRMKFFPKDQQNLATKIREWDSETVVKAFGEYLKENSDFLRRQRHPFGVFAKQIESYIVEEEPEKPAEPTVEFEGKMIPVWLRDEKIREQEELRKKRQARELQQQEEENLGKIQEAMPL